MMGEQKGTDSQCLGRDDAVILQPRSCSNICLIERTASRSRTSPGEKRSGNEMKVIVNPPRLGFSRLETLSPMFVFRPCPTSPWPF